MSIGELEAIRMLTNSVNRIESKIDHIVDVMITKNECTQRQGECSFKTKYDLEIKKAESETKKILAISTLVSVIIGLIIGFLK
jgi:hypothetical protein